MVMTVKISCFAHTKQFTRISNSFNCSGGSIILWLYGCVHIIFLLYKYVFKLCDITKAVPHGNGQFYKDMF